MRIRVIQTPTQACIDGVRLDLFVVGCQYEVGNTLGAYLLAEGWAEPVDDFRPALAIPLDEFAPDHRPGELANLQREQYPPYYDGPHIALDRRRRRRHA